MTKREVQQGLLSYRDADGVWRHALGGETVDVDPKFLEEFDGLNEPDKPKKAATKKAAPRK